MSLSKCSTQNDLLLENLKKFYSNKENLKTVMSIIIDTTKTRKKRDGSYHQNITFEMAKPEKTQKYSNKGKFGDIGFDIS